MSDLDGLRGIWAERLSRELVDWSGLYGPADAEVAPTIWAPLSTAWLVARTSRVITDGDPVDPLEVIEQAIPLNDLYPTGGQIVGGVERALENAAWPEGLPEDPRAAELLFCELWSATRRREISATALHRELAQRWGIADPRMLGYLSRLEPEPFDRYLDFADVMLERVDDERTQHLLLFLWNKFHQSSDERASHRLDALPPHLARLAEPAGVVLRMESSIKKFASGWDADMQAAANGALRELAAHREHLANLLSRFTAYEVELIQTAVFGTAEQ